MLILYGNYFFLRLRISKHCNIEICPVSSGRYLGIEWPWEKTYQLESKNPYPMEHEILFGKVQRAYF